MMDPAHLQIVAIGPAFRLLGPGYSSVPAAALLTAIALQESGLSHRHQVGGPAHGLWQFEPIGCDGVLSHPASKSAARRVCAALLVPALPDDAYRALEHCDVLAAAFARLALWRLPAPLPGADDGPQAAWDQYVDAWRPGKPHRHRWDENWAIAWSLYRE